VPSDSDTAKTIRRRLSTILSADVVDSVRLIRQNEEAALEKIRACLLLMEQAVAGHGGRAFSDTGDGILAEFQSVVEAARCAIEIQAQNETRNDGLPEEARVRLRIGLNLGDVVVDDKNLRGDSVNVAARLQSIAEPGTICIAGAVYEQIKNSLPLQYRDMGPQSLKNIAEQVHCYLVSDRLARPAPKAGSQEAQPIQKPMIAVLPFKNFGSDSEQTYFSDGFTEDVITELSRFRTISVISRTSSFAYRDKAIPVREIGRELNAQYLVEGSVRRKKDHLRITAQLLDSETGAHVWAERYDVSVEDVMAVQDEVVRQVVGALEQRMVMAQLDRSKRLAGNALQAYEYWLRGRFIFSRYSAEAQLEALPCFEKAIELDPNFARAHASLASIYNSISVLNPGSPNTSENLERALASALRAVELDPADARPHVDLGWTYMLRREFPRAARQFDLAGSLNPNEADVMIARAQAAAFLGKPADGLPLARMAIKTNPHHPGYYLHYLATIQCLAQQFDEALASLDLAHVTLPGKHVWHAAILAQLGRTDEAHSAAETFATNVRQRWTGDPAASVADYVQWFFRVTPLARQEDIQLLTDGLRRAGLAI
jgi:adenylate cyclase